MKTLEKMKGLLEQRGTEYGETWLKVGQLMQQFNVVNAPLFVLSPYGHNWVQIQGKLFRALTSPFNADHWFDIACYAALVAQHLAEQENQE